MSAQKITIEIEIPEVPIKISSRVRKSSAKKVVKKKAAKKSAVKKKTTKKTATKKKVAKRTAKKSAKRK